MWFISVLAVYSNGPQWPAWLMKNERKGSPSVYKQLSFSYNACNWRLCDPEVVGREEWMTLG